MQLSDDEIRHLRAFLMGTDAFGFARFIANLQLDRGKDSLSASFRDAAVHLGWLHPGEDRFTELGLFAADSCREYCFWRERDRLLPFVDMIPHVVSEHVLGKSVLEIGSGSGMNLLSMASQARAVVGLEPVTIYRQIGAILAELEGYGAVTSVPGRAEDLPFEDGQFDTVLCVTAHQYFDLNPALAEIARVLKPGGEAVLISGTLSGYVKGQANQIFAGLRPARSYGVTIANTLGYMFLGRRVFTRVTNRTTAYPIYPARWSMRRMMAAAGLELVEPPVRADGEAAFRARKTETPMAGRA